jgi:ABC-type glycerol-3-phosphate transport system permease component
MKRTPLHQLLVYVLLLLGAIVFTFPFIWMVSSSMKVDREMFTEDLKVLPNTPRPMSKSPYVDDAYFISLKPGGVSVEELQSELEKLVDASGFPIPDDVDKAVARREIARGLYQRLGARISGETWNGTTDKPANASAIIEAARTVVDQELVRQTFVQIYRFAAVASVRIRDQGINLYELASDKTPANRWTIQGSAQATLTDFNDQGKPAAKLSYDFASGSDIQLVGNFEAETDLAKMKSVRIDFHPDDTWHNVTLTIEHNGRKFVSERQNFLANFDWQTYTWQHASDDDKSTKLRQWIVLNDAGPSEVSDPKQIRMTLDIHRVNQAYAWANKSKNNFIRTSEQIPFWRYVRVSVFLVLANVVLTVISCSFVAYGFSRIIFPGRDLLFLILLATMMIPGQVTMIPSFLIWKTLGAYDTLTPLWFGAAFGSAFFVFMLRQFMLGIPRDLEDAARIDGCGFLRIYWHVILPLIKPSLAAIAVMTFIGVWQDFMGPLIYIADQRLYSLSFGLYAFSVQVNNNPALTMAGSVLMTVPIIVIFFVAQRYFIQGITLTGMKG